MPAHGRFRRVDTAFFDELDERACAGRGFLGWRLERILDKISLEKSFYLCGGKANGFFFFDAQAYFTLSFFDFISFLLVYTMILCHLCLNTL